MNFKDLSQAAVMEKFDLPDDISPHKKNLINLLYVKVKCHLAIVGCFIHLVYVDL